MKGGRKHRHPDQESNLSYQLINQQGSLHANHGLISTDGGRVFGDQLALLSGTLTFGVLAATVATLSTSLLCYLRFRSRLAQNRLQNDENTNNHSTNGDSRSNDSDAKDSINATENTSKLALENPTFSKTTTHTSLPLPLQFQRSHLNFVDDSLKGYVFQFLLVPILFLKNNLLLMFALEIPMIRKEK